jgi:hypothetical protein
MSDRVRTAVAIVTVSVMACFLPLPAMGQTAPDGWTLPRTLNGQPDLQGVWANNVATPMERPTELADRQVLTDEEVARLKTQATELFDGNGAAAFGDSVFLAALAEAQEYESTDGQTGNYNSFWLVDRDFDNRTSLISDPPDGRLPPVTSEAETKAAAASAARQQPPAGPEDLTVALRCITPGVPNLFAGYNSYYHIVQTHGYVAIATEMYHDVRIIPLDGRPHLSPALRQWNGDSRGHWEGDTLVVDTMNFVDQGGTGRTRLRLSAGENLHLVERFTRVGPDTLNYEFTIDDPATWTAPWTAMIPLKRSEDNLYEFACHEGNRSMGGILGGNRAQERADADATQTASP